MPKRAFACLVALAILSAACSSEGNPTATSQIVAIEPEIQVPEDQAGQEEPVEDENEQLSDEERAAALVNPFAGDEASTKAGAEIYQMNCATCHGETGSGDGPSAIGLEMPPADLSSSAVQDLTDGSIFHIITHGKPDTPMPAWEAVLDEEDRWAVVNFLRTFKEPPG